MQIFLRKYWILYRVIGICKLLHTRVEDRFRAKSLIKFFAVNDLTTLLDNFTRPFTTPSQNGKINLARGFSYRLKKKDELYFDSNKQNSVFFVIFSKKQKPRPLFFRIIWHHRSRIIFCKKNGFTISPLTFKRIFSRYFFHLPKNKMRSCKYPPWTRDAEI